MPLAIDLILVPQGAEYAAVCRGLREIPHAPTVLPMPVGAVNVTRHLHQLHQTQQLQAGQRVLVMGLCGGLTPSVPVGSVVLYQVCRAVAHPAESWTGDRALTAEIQAHLGTQAIGVTAVTSDLVVCRAQDKQQLGQQTQADVVDMEGTATLASLAKLGIAAATVRIVSDDCQRDIPDLTPVFDAQGRLRPLPLAWAMLQRPIAAWTLIRGSTGSLKILQKTTINLLHDHI